MLLYFIFKLNKKDGETAFGSSNHVRPLEYNMFSVYLSRLQVGSRSG